jgi:hypothetical protein
MHDQDPLDALLALAKSHSPAPSDDFMARILADAVALQPKPQIVRAAAPQRRSGFWTRFATILGGASAVAGIGTAAMAGLVLGYVQPDSLAAVAGGFGFETPSESLELLPGLDTILTEE